MSAAMKIVPAMSVSLREACGDCTIRWSEPKDVLRKIVRFQTENTFEKLGK